MSPDHRPTTTSEQARGRTIFTVFEVKKEIPDLHKQLAVVASDSRLAGFLLEE
jgi:hypothetical protein